MAFSRETEKERNPSFWVDEFKPDEDKHGVCSTSMLLYCTAKTDRSFLATEDLSQFKGLVLRKTIPSKDANQAERSAIIGYVLVDTGNGNGGGGKVYRGVPESYRSNTLWEHCYKALGVPASKWELDKPAGVKISSDKPLDYRAAQEGYQDMETDSIENVHGYRDILTQTRITVYMDGKAKVNVYAPVRPGSRRFVVTGLPSELEPSSISVSDGKLLGFVVQETESQARAATALGYNSDLIGRHVVVHWTEDVDSAGDGTHSRHMRSLTTRVHKDEGLVVSLIPPPSALSEKYGLVLRSNSKEDVYPLKAIYGNISKIEVRARKCEEALMLTETMGSVLHLTLDKPTTNSLSLNYICSGISWSPVYHLRTYPDGSSELEMRARVTNFSGVWFWEAKLTLVDGYLQPFNQRLQNIPYNDLGVRGVGEQDEAVVQEAAPSLTPATSLLSYSTFQVNGTRDNKVSLCQDYPGRESSKFFQLFSEPVPEKEVYMLYGAHRVKGALEDKVSMVLQFRNNTEHSLPKGAIYIKGVGSSMPEYLTEITKPVEKDGLVSLNAGEYQFIRVHRHPEEKSHADLEGGGERHTITQRVTFIDNGDEGELEITVLLKLKAKEELLHTYFYFDGNTKEVPFERWEDLSSKNRPNPFTGEPIPEADQSWYYFKVPLRKTTVTAIYELEYLSN